MLSGPALASIIATTLRMNLRRLTVWVFAAVFVVIVCLLYWGGLSFGGMSATGAKLATNSDYAVAAVLGAFSFLLMHFTATLTGDPVVKDVRLGIAPLLRATPLERRTYLIGKFLGGYVSVLSIYAVFLVSLMLGQLLPPDSDKLTLPFRFWPYFKFAFLYMLVPTFFIGGLSFMIGTLSGSMKTVYITVTALFVTWLLTDRFVSDDYWSWFSYFEPSGTLWLAEHVAKSRGNAWLNTNPIRPDLGFALNRAGVLTLGAGCLVYTLLRYSGDDDRGEYGGEVREGYLTRFLRWVTGRQRVVADRYTNWVGHGSIPLVEPAPRGFSLWIEHLRSSTVTEVRLLTAERSLWIMIPVIVVLAVFTTGSTAGPFRVPIYPVSSEYAAGMVVPLLILIAGTSIFYTGEVFHRDDANAVRSIIYSTPVANSVLLLSKLLAMVALSFSMVLWSYATAIVTQAVLWWRLDGSFYLDLGPYLEIGLRLMLPVVIIISAISLVLNVLVRGRYLAYFALISLCAGYLWLLFDGERSILFNPLLIGHLRYSDMTALEPFAETLRLHYLYWGALVGFLLCLATWFLARSSDSQWSLKHHFQGSYARRRTGLLTVGLASLGLSAFGATLIQANSSLYGTRAEVEAAQLRIEDEYGDQLFAPSLGYAAIDIEVDLRPEERGLDVRGTLTLQNDHVEPLDQVIFTVDPLYTIRSFELDRQSGAHELVDGILTVALDPPVAPGEQIELRLDWSGTVNPGIARNGGAQSTFIHRSATFVNSFAPEVIPVLGVMPELLMSDRKHRREHGLAPLEIFADRSGEWFVPAALGPVRPFDLRARISAPAGQMVLCGGELIERTPQGERETFVYESREPLYTFAILAGDYDMRESGDDEVWFHPEHTQNLDTVLAALRDGRDFFEESFGPYPHRLLRIVEFPRLAGFAQSYPTLMPYSEAIGFLTNFREDDRFVDATYFVTAHEVAHQWWAYIESPGASRGAQVLSESLAEYSAMVLLDEKRGERARLVFLRREEAGYLRGRDPDLEEPLVELDFEGRAVWYNKGCLVFYMLERQIGRERLLAALADFVARWRVDRDDPDFTDADPRRRQRALSHPTVHDLIGTLQAHHRDLDVDWFYDAWFHDVVVPDMAVVGTPELVRESDGSWSVSFEVSNLATEGMPAMPVEVELVRGNWRAHDKGSMVDGEWEVSPAMEIWIAPGQTARASLSSTFAPDALVVDRMHECLDFDRTNNARDLPGSGSKTDAAGSAARVPAGRQ
jgi:hypothetical protein